MTDSRPDLNSVDHSPKTGIVSVHFKSSDGLDDIDLKTDQVGGDAASNSAKKFGK